MPNSNPRKFHRWSSSRRPWRVQAVSVLLGYRLAVTFRDGSSGIADCSAIRTAEMLVFCLAGGRRIFARVTVALGVLTWPNGADLDPAWMHESLASAKTWSVPLTNSKRKGRAMTKA